MVSPLASWTTARTVLLNGPPTAAIGNAVDTAPEGTGSAASPLTKFSASSTDTVPSAKIRLSPLIALITSLPPVVRVKVTTEPLKLRE
jgi:hypothetical protein